MTNLLIDIGNTRLKWGTDSGRGLVFGGECESKLEMMASELLPQWSEISPKHVLVSCVGDRAVLNWLSKTVESRWHIPAQVLVSPRQGFGITSSYPCPEKLGSDRWAAMVAAYAKIGGPVCVVSCGTAVTLDAVSPAGLHLGGLILPGFHLMQSCLQQETRLNFKITPAAGPSHRLGTDTETCIQQGTTTAIFGMTHSVYQDLRHEYKEMRLLITGGDAALLQDWFGDEAATEPHLVLQGLAVIATDLIAADES